MKRISILFYFFLTCVFTLSFNKVKPEHSRMIINEICDLIGNHYILKDKVPSIIDSLNNYQETGEYDLLNGKSLAQKLTVDIKRISSDKHFRVHCSSKRVNGLNTRSKEGLKNGLQDKWKEIETQSNYGFVKTEILEGNVGYMKIDEFTNPSYTEAVFVKELEKLKGVQGIVFDLSDCIGGSGVMVRRVISYFTPKKERLPLYTYECSNSKSIGIVTDKKLIGERILNIPMAVIISSKTYSAGETFSYVLQQHKLAKVFGQTSKGGAHSWKEYNINDSLSIQIPTCRPIHPVTESNWEGVGVIPDVECENEEAISLCRKYLLSIIE